MKPTEEKIRANASDLPIYLFKQGNNCEAYRYFGAHLDPPRRRAGRGVPCMGAACRCSQCGG